MTDEAGFDALVGSEESRINSRLYSERALVMSKGFVVYALFHEVTGLDDIIEWLYLSREVEGPRLLERIVQESKALLELTAPEQERTQPSQPPLNWDSQLETMSKQVYLSSGAKVLLQKHLTAMERKFNEVYDI